MRLTNILMHFKKRQKVIPYRFRGKYRLVKEVTNWDLIKLRNDFDREENNMRILRHPYLTSEQTEGYMKDYRLKNNIPTNFEATLLSVNRQRNELFQKHFTWADQLCHYRVKDSWE